MPFLPPPNNLLHCQLASRSHKSLRDAYLAFLNTNRDAANASAVEFASAAFLARYHHCDELGHLANDCPYSDQFKQLIVCLKNSNTNYRWGRAGDAALLTWHPLPLVLGSKPPPGTSRGTFNSGTSNGVDHQELAGVSLFAIWSPLTVGCAIQGSPAQ